MTASEFFEKAEEILNDTKGADTLAVEFYIQDMEEMFKKWDDPDYGEDGS